MLFSRLPSAPESVIAMENVVTFYSQKPRRITVNGEPIESDRIDAAAPDFADSPKPREAAARALVIRKLLRQRATVLRIEADTEEAAVEKLLQQEVVMQPISDDEVSRYYAGNRQKFRSGDLFQVRHILFDTTGEADKTAKVQHADGVLLLLKTDPQGFAAVARKESCCTSAEVGGELGQLSPGSVVPEFWSALVGFGKTGLLPHLVETGYGHHIVMIDRYAAGQELPFEIAEPRIRQYLASRLEQLAYQQYVAGLIEQSAITGVDFGDQKPQAAGPGLPIE